MIDLGSLTDDVHAIAAHHGVPATAVVPVTTQGQVNLTVFLGSELVLRIPRHARAADLLAKEAEVIPLVLAAGVPTAALVTYDTTLQVGRVPYVVMERLHGETLAEQTDSVVQRRAWQSLGEIIGALHRVTRDTVGSPTAIPSPFTFSPTEVVQRLLEAGEIGRTQGDWLLEQFDRLNPEGPASPDPVLLHRDVSPSNVLVEPNGRVTALLDWGCAEWGSPARDLVGLRLEALPDLLSGYRSARQLSASPGSQDPGHWLERDALWFHLYLALSRLLKEPSNSEDRNWAAPRQATLIDIFAFVSGGTADSWSALLQS